MKITVVRHGETEGNVARIAQSHADGVLTARGVEQAQQVADSLRDQIFDLIVCSDLGRCVQTAGIIVAARNNQEVVYTKMLRERSLGVYDGRQWEDVPWETIEGDSLDQKLPEGEAWTEVAARIEAYLNELFESYADSRVLVVTHGGIMKAMAALLDRISLAEAVDSRVVDNGSVRVWDMTGPVRPVTVR